PTITIETNTDLNAVDNAAPPRSLASTTDPSTSPTTLTVDMPQPSQAPTSSKPKLLAANSSGSKDSRTQSPHSVSSSVAARKSNRSLNYLEVPNNQRLRQSSVDSEDGSRSYTSSQGDTTVLGTTSWQGDKSEKGGHDEHDKIMNDPDALKPDAGREADFQVENNPFAFNPGQLTKMFNPTSLAAYYAMGGLKGIEKGLRSNRDTGLSIDEKHIDKTITFEEATSKSSKLANEGVETPQTPVARRNTAGTS
ncbi:hypothetical protein JX266_014435, partial [Neoarthrinium moseri]